MIIIVGEFAYLVVVFTSSDACVVKEEATTDWVLIEIIGWHDIITS
jgi:hypothetical protein